MIKYVVSLILCIKYMCVYVCDTDGGRDREGMRQRQEQRQRQTDRQTDRQTERDTAQALKTRSMSSSRIQYQIAVITGAQPGVWDYVGLLARTH